MAFVQLMALLVAVTILASQIAAQAAVNCAGNLVLVTGATGRTGRIVVELLREKHKCVRILTRRPSTAGFAADVEVAEGSLGNIDSVKSAFQGRSSSGNVGVSHVVFAAGGEQADFDEVNNKGLALCAEEAASAGAKTIVVISSAWVTKPYSLASLLFNTLYDKFPMALHLLGEDALRDTARRSGMSYVILRPGALVEDKDYDFEKDPVGILLTQGDSMGFLRAGRPGLAYSPLAHAIVTALEVEGRVTVEITNGEQSQHDVTLYDKMVRDTGPVMAAEDIVEKHGRALSNAGKMTAAVGVGSVATAVAIVRRRLNPLPGLLLILLIWGGAGYAWWVRFADMHILLV